MLIDIRRCVMEGAVALGQQISACEANVLAYNDVFLLIGCIALATLRGCRCSPSVQPCGHNRWPSVGDHCEEQKVSEPAGFRAGQRASDRTRSGSAGEGGVGADRSCR